VSQQSIVRHYRAPTRDEVEHAYRSDALKAAGAGYVAIQHDWTDTPDGLLLAVTYTGPAPKVEDTQPEPTSEAATAPTNGVHTPPRQESEVADEPEPEFADEPEAVAEPQAIAEPELAAEPELVAEPEPVAEREPVVEPEPHAEPNVGVQPMRTYTPVQRISELDQAAEQTAEHIENVVEEPSAAETAPAEPLEDESLPEPEAQAEQAADPDQAPEPEQAPDTTEFPRRVPEPQTHNVSRSARMTIQVMDLHTAGEPLRLVRSGFPDVPMLPVLERRQWVKENVDHVRRALMYEPRGHSDMYGAILLPPYNDYADMTVLFMHNEGYSTMCGHGVIAVTTGLIEEGLYPATEPVTTIRYEVPAGIVAANAATVRQEDGSWAVRGVRFTNVPSYLAAQSLSIRPDGVELHGTAAEYGALGMDIAFGGAYYGIVNAAELGLRVVPDQADELRRVGAAITDVLRRDHTPSHPSDPDLSFVYGTIIVDLDPASSPDGKARSAHIRNATIFADAELDRSPCGSGTSAILAQLHARGRLKVGQEIINAGITGEHFLGRVEAATALGPYPAISTSVAGSAFITGYTTFVVDARDPLGDGFLLS
jgi:trans-L-3-hydroxyproline dehydratase